MVHLNALRQDQVPPEPEIGDESYIVRFAEKTAEAAYYQDELALQELWQEMQQSQVAFSAQYQKIRTIIDRLLVPAVADLNSLHLSYATQVKAFERACRRVGCEDREGYVRSSLVDINGLGERIDRAIFG